MNKMTAISNKRKQFCLEMETFQVKMRASPIALYIIECCRLSFLMQDGARNSLDSLFQALYLCSVQYKGMCFGMCIMSFSL